MSETLENAILCLCAYFIVLIGSIANAISLSYFLRQTKTTASTFIFITNNAVDLIVCMSVTPVLLSTTAQGAPLLFTFQPFCSFWNYFYAVSLRMSMFVMAMLCVTRTLSLVKPLYGIRVWHLVICLVFYLVYLVTVRLVGVEKVVYDVGHMFCVSEYRQDLTANYTKIIIDSSKILVPIVPSVLGCLITIVNLTSSKGIKQAGGGCGPSSNKREAIITVVILTVIFLITSTPHFVLIVSEAICIITKDTCMSFPSKFLHHLFCFYIPTLNSALNPLVYLIRIKKLRTYTYSLVTCSALRDKDKIRPSENESGGVSGGVSRGVSKGVSKGVSRLALERDARISPGFVRMQKTNVTEIQSPISITKRTANR